MHYPIIRFPNERGQGLVEYALILVLVAVVVIAALYFLGPSIERTYCRIIFRLGGNPEQCQFINIMESTCNPSGHLLLRVTYGAGYDPSVTLTTSPGGVMHGSAEDNDYHSNIDLGTCSGTVTITSSRGDVEMVTVGP